MTRLIQPRPVLPSPDDVRAFEVELGFDLPGDYRAFLLSHDGGDVEGSRPAGEEEARLGFQAEAVPPLADDRWIAPGGFWDVALFHGLLRKAGEYGDLRDILPAMRDWDHPAELLPVASRADNAKYFLCLASARPGQVLFAGDTFLDKRADGLPITVADYHRLTESFGELLDALVWRRD